VPNVLIVIPACAGMTSGTEDLEQASKDAGDIKENGRLRGRFPFPLWKSDA